MSLLEQEYLKVMLLDTRNQVIDIVEIYHGSVNTSQVRVAEIYKPAIQRMASGILVFHNHPSGDPQPSPDDVAVTRAIRHAGHLLDIELVDHIVLGSYGRYVSLKERGLGFDEKVSERRSSYRLGEQEVIYTYTRAQALEDGVLIDVSQMAKEAGFRLPAVITADLHATLTPNRRERCPRPILRRPAVGHALPGPLCCPAGNLAEPDRLSRLAWPSARPNAAGCANAPCTCGW